MLRTAAATQGEPSKILFLFRASHVTCCFSCLLRAVLLRSYHCPAGVGWLVGHTDVSTKQQSQLLFSTAKEGRKAATDKLVEKIVKHDSCPIQPDIINPPLLRLTSGKPLWLDLQPVDIKSRWRHNWKSAQVVNSHLVCNSTIQ